MGFPTAQPTLEVGVSGFHVCTATPGRGFRGISSAHWRVLGDSRVFPLGPCFLHSLSWGHFSSHLRVKCWDAGPGPPAHAHLL